MTETKGRSRVFVTGAGVVSAIGSGVEQFWSALRQNRTGIRPLEMADFVNNGPDLPQLEAKRRLGARMAFFDQRARLGHWQRDKTILHSDRYSWLGAAAADEAVRSSGLTFPFTDGRRAASIFGSAFGGHMTVELASLHRFVMGKHAVHPMTLVRIIGSSAAAHIGIEFGAMGATFGVASGGASASHAISLGVDHIRHGMADIVIVGGSDSTMTSSALLTGQQLGLLSGSVYRPFARNRDGMVLGEGAGCLVLESERHARQRGATVLAEICGVGLASGGEDMLAADRTSQVAAMSAALADAGLAPDAVGYLNACGLGTRAGDPVEAGAIRDVFADHADELPVSATKPSTGNTLGASGAIEAIICMKAIEDGWLPPTLGLDDPDPDCRLDHVTGEGRSCAVEFAMSNSFGIGGFAASIIIGRPPA